MMTFLPAVPLRRGATVRVSACGEFRTVKDVTHPVVSPDGSSVLDHWVVSIPDS